MHVRCSINEETTHFARAILALQTNKDALADMTVVSGAGRFEATFSEMDIKRWGLPPKHRLERRRLHEGEILFAHLTCIGPVNNAATSWDLRGLSLKLPVELNNFSRGKRIEVGVVARSGAECVSHAMMAVYATQEAGNSGWRSLALKPTFELLTFTYEVPATVERYTKHPILVIHSDENGASRSVEMLGAYVKVSP